MDPVHNLYKFSSCCGAISNAWFPSYPSVLDNNSSDKSSDKLSDKSNDDSDKLSDNSSVSASGNTNDKSIDEE